MADFGKWVRDTNGKFLLAPVQDIDVAEMGLVVGIRLVSPRKEWEPQDPDRHMLQVALPPQTAREVGQALMEMADLVENGTGQA